MAEQYQSRGSPTITRRQMADVIYDRLLAAEEDLGTQFADPTHSIAAFVLDDLLPVEWAHRIRDGFPDPAVLFLRHSLREKKYVGVEMNRYAAVVEEAVYAFQDPRVVNQIGRITGLQDLVPDPYLYAGGISLMGPGHFLHPHLDNSHDKDRQYWRAVNLLYYVSPDWRAENGGNLELWDQGPERTPREIVSRFNRLVVMATHHRSYIQSTRLRSTISGVVSPTITSRRIPSTETPGTT
jgi:Rps23 Pro-64 3,4-dihydroxylase Tpa1-like proline 4-hydroxylase